MAISPIRRQGRRRCFAIWCRKRSGCCHRGGSASATVSPTQPKICSPPVTVRSVSSMPTARPCRPRCWSRRRRCSRAPGDRVVLGPAEDGGYYCIGLKNPHARLFEDIDWSTERVFAQTMDRAREIGLDTAVLPVWYDVDDLASLRRLAEELLGKPIRELERSRFAAPHTAAFLRRLLGNGGGRRIGIASPTAGTGSTRP